MGPLVSDPELPRPVGLGTPSDGVGSCCGEGAWEDRQEGDGGDFMNHRLRRDRRRGLYYVCMHLDGRRIAYIKIDDKIRSKIRNRVWRNT
jgi:hypothetical protein